jgi:hypothetical protein
MTGDGKHATHLYLYMAILVVMAVMDLLLYQHCSQLLIVDFIWFHHRNHIASPYKKPYLGIHTRLYLYPNSSSMNSHKVP